MTPEQMRALAEMAGALAYHDRDKYVAESAAALRTAADQLEAVRKAAWNQRSVSADLLMAILTADTAPHADDCRYWGGYPQRACTCKQTPERGNE